MKKVFSLLLATALLLFSLFSLTACGKEKGALSEPITAFMVEAFNFRFYCPGSFTKMSVKLDEESENEDEGTVTFSIPGTDEAIVITVKKNPEASFYDYIQKNGFDTAYMKANGTDCFSYDMRGAYEVGEDPSYYVIAATRTHVFTASYSYKEGNIEAHDMCDGLNIVFTSYANHYRTNAFLSPEIPLLDGLFSIRVPIMAEKTLLPYLDEIPYLPIEPDTSLPETPVTSEAEPATGEESGPVTGEPPATEDAPPLQIDTSKYSQIRVQDTYYYADFMLYHKENAVYKDDAITKEMIDALTPAEVAAYAVYNLTDVEFIEEGRFSVGANLTYVIRNFTCNYRDASANGTVMIGYAQNGVSFIYIYALNEKAPDGEKPNYEDMLASIAFH